MKCSVYLVIFKSCQTEELLGDPQPQTLFLDLKANLARALALERSMRSTKKGRASLCVCVCERERERERVQTETRGIKSMNAHSCK